MAKPRPTPSALASVLLALAALLLAPLALVADAAPPAQQDERAAAAALALSPTSLKSGAASLGANDCVGASASACLLSPNKRYRLCLLQNGDIVVQDSRAPQARRTLWASGTANKVPARKRPATLCLLSDGLLAAYRKDWSQYWASPKPPAAAGPSGAVTGYVQDDGVFAIYDARCNLLWSTTRRVGVASVQPPCAGSSGSDGGTDGPGTVGGSSDGGASNNSTGTDGTGGASKNSTGGTDGGGNSTFFNVTDAVPAYRTEMLALVNEARQAAGKAPLVLSAELNAAADKHAQVMYATRSVGHDLPGDLPYSQRLLRDLGMPWLMCGIGENTGGGSATAAEMHAGFMGSPAHAANVLTADYKSMGVGQVNGFWTELFAGCVSP